MMTYGISSFEITAPPDAIFFLPYFDILTGNQIGVKGKHNNIEPRTKSGTEGQHPRHTTRYPNTYGRPTTSKIEFDIHSGIGGQYQSDIYKAIKRPQSNENKRIATRQ